MRQRLILQTDGQPRYALRGQPVTVVVYPDQRLEMLRRQQVLPFKIFHPEQHVATPVDDKTLNTRVDDVLRRLASPPCPSHPWRRWVGEQPPPGPVRASTA